MRTVTGPWFETKVKYEKMQEDGRQKNVTESYVVKALSWGDAEKKIAQEMASYLSGEMEIKAISPASYKEVFFSDSDTDDKWYKAKVAFIYLDEKTGNEKKSNFTYLVQGSSVAGAVRNVDNAMNGTMVDYTSLAVSETKIMDVFE